MADNSDNPGSADARTNGVLPDALPLDAAESQLLRALRSTPMVGTDRDEDRVPSSRDDTLVDLTTRRSGLQQDGLTPVFTEP